MADRAPVTHDSRGRARVQTVNDQPSLTVQSDIEKSDINAILKRYDQVGIIDHLAAVDAQFLDVSQFEDFHDVMQQAKAAEAVFMRLPSKLREVFDHDASKWLDAAHDPEKVEALRPQLEALGVLDPLPAPATPAPNPSPEGDGE